MANKLATRVRERIKELRLAKGLSQERLAVRAGLKYKHYQALEAGRKRDFRISTFEKLAKAVGVEPWEVIRVRAKLVMGVKAPRRQNPQAKKE